jgi:naphthoate synthase
VGRKRAKEIWFLNRKYTAVEAREIGLVNEVVAGQVLMARAREIAAELMQRGPGALAALKSAFSARNTGVIGQARLGHDQLLSYYMTTEEHEELSDAFRGRREPDQTRFLS